MTDTIFEMNDKGDVLFLHADMREALKALPENSVDSVVTDPPYLLTSIVKRFGGDNSAPAQFGSDGRFTRLSGGFMNLKWDSPESAQGLSVFEAWLAGFVAGEGCFRIQAHNENKYYTCQFSIHLRQDDAAILTACQKRIGGRICFQEERENKQGIKSKPDVRWIVDTKRTCLALAAILDRVPLFAKKANDYALWRRALDLWVNTPKGSRWHGPRDVAEMAVLHRQLQSIKRWDGSEIDLNFDPFMSPEHTFHYQWAREVMRVLKPGGYIVSFSGSRTYGRMQVALEDAGFITHPMIGWITAQGFPKGTKVDDPAWQGWRYGTQSLKPALEPIYMGQKPFSEKTGTANIQRWRTGAVNIDGCRIGPRDRTEYGLKKSKRTQGAVFRNPSENADFDSSKGRWPANLVIDESDEVIAMFPNTAPSRSGKPRSGKSGNGWGMTATGAEYDDSGSAARFFFNVSNESDIEWLAQNLPNELANDAVLFFNLDGNQAASVLKNAVARATRQSVEISGAYRELFTSVTLKELKKISETVIEMILNLGGKCSLESLPRKLFQSDSRVSIAAIQEQIGTITITISRSKSNGYAGNVTLGITQPYLELGAAGYASSFNYAAKASRADRAGSRHPTCKPISLMRWLTRLITPPGGLVLDPFAGSGTTGAAALEEGMRCLLIEREAEYADDIRRRLSISDIGLI